MIQLHIPSISKFLVALFPLFGLFGASSVTAQNHRPKPDPNKTNVLFLICDDLNCDLSCYGQSSVPTPNIDKLAARGVLFERAYCQYPLCGPSRASFMTGLYPDQNLVKRNAIYVREKVPNVLTIPQTFRSANYFAHRINKIYHYNVPRHIGTSGHDDPYSWNQTTNTRGRDKTDEDLIFSLRKNNFGGTLSWLAADGDDAEQTDGLAAHSAAQAIKQFAASQQPFYLAVGLFRPHTPYVAPKKYFEKVDRKQLKISEVPDNYLSSLPRAAAKSVSGKKDQRDLPTELAQEAKQAYYASIMFADAQIKIIINALEAAGIRDNTIIVFTSDHGYHMSEHGHWQKMTLFENATRVPMIIAGPGISEGQRTKAFFELVDLYPTLTELCGLEPAKFASGVSQVPVLSGKQERVRDSALSQMGSGYSLRTDRYRFTSWGKNGKDGFELYDHRDDPGEMHNLANSPEHQRLKESLLLQLQQRIEEASRVPKGLRQNLNSVARSVPQPND